MKSSKSVLYQIGLEQSINGAKLICDCGSGIHYVYIKINLNRGGSYIDSSICIKSKKAIINLKYNEDKCFRYTISVALNHEKIKKDLQKIRKFWSFIKQFEWKGITFPSRATNCKKFKTNYNLIALNVWLIPHKKHKVSIDFKIQFRVSKLGNCFSDHGRWKIALPCC